MTVPVTYREPNEALGWTSEGLPRLEPVRACYIRVVEVWRTTVFAATREDAAAEGHKTYEDYLAAWGNEDARVLAFRFELDQRHHPRLLTRQVIAGRCGAYVEDAWQAMWDEPEAVDVFTQRRLTEEGNARDLEREIRKQAVVAQLPFDSQVAALAAEARRRHIDVRDELRAIERWTDADARSRQLERLREKVSQRLAVAA